MATVIRFSRHGSKKRPYFRIVVQDHRFARDGRFIEHIGSFEPTKGEQTFKIERDRLEYWLSTGAQPSLSIRNHLKRWKKTQGTSAGIAADAPPPKSAAKAKAGKTKEKAAE